MEAEPPIAVFPRDFPDTDAGEAYWSGHDSEWNTVRCCLEDGARGGRFKTELKRTLKTSASGTHTHGAPYHPIDWRSMTDLSSAIEEGDADDKGSDGKGARSVEVVRGTFGAPFAQALTGSGRFTPESDAKERRPRRRVRPANVAIHAEPLEDEEVDAHETLCQMLLSSLSLPALLRCHVTVEGKGNLVPGATIFEYNEKTAAQSPTTLGYIVAGAFSSKRGLCHGPGFLGAAKFLQSLILNGHANTVSIMNQGGGGNRSVAVRVLVKNVADGSVMRSATLRLMF